MAHVATLASAYLGGNSSYESKEDHTYPEYAANRCVWVSVEDPKRCKNYTSWSATFDQQGDVAYNQGPRPTNLSCCMGCRADQLCVPAGCRFSRGKWPSQELPYRQFSVVVFDFARRKRNQTNYNGRLGWILRLSDFFWETDGGEYALPTGVLPSTLVLFHRRAHFPIHVVSREGSTVLRCSVSCFPGDAHVRASDKLLRRCQTTRNATTKQDYLTIFHAGHEIPTLPWWPFLGPTVSTTFFEGSKWCFPGWHGEVGTTIDMWVFHLYFRWWREMTELICTMKRYVKYLQLFGILAWNNLG